MKKIIALILCLNCGVLGLMAQSENRLPMRTSFIEDETTTISLCGTWNFSLLDEATGAKQSGKIDVPASWETRGYGYPNYSNDTYPFPNTPGVISRGNFIGTYSRSFTLEDSWITAGKKVVIDFAGVYSYYKVYINKKYVGAGDDSCLDSEFDITPFVKKGSNSIEVVVWKYARGSYLEDQDHWRLGGIYRDVTLRLEAYPCGIWSAEYRTVLSSDYASARLSCRPTIAFPALYGETPAVENDVAGMAKRYNVCPPEFENYVLSLSLTREDTLVCCATKSLGEVFARKRYNQRAALAFEGIGLDVECPTLWDPEHPELYRATLCLCTPTGDTLDCKKTNIGFRDVRINGGELLINGKSVKLRGVNHHDHSDLNGKTMSREDCLKDLTLMKEANVNCIRLSHYPSCQYLYDLADEMGFFVIDEANIEAHHSPSRLADDLSWASDFMERGTRMVVRDYNHPSVIWWSLGNESGIGANHAALYSWMKYYDPTRPVHYEGAQNRPDDDLPYTDIISRMYEPVEVLEDMATSGLHTRPIFECEYYHAMGNSFGNMKEYWDLIYSHKNLIGGCIWDWIDQGLLCDGVKFGKAAATSKVKGERYWAYGGDGEVREADSGNFCINGIINPDRSLKPQYYEMKYWYQPLLITREDGTGRFKVVSRDPFCALEDYSYTWKITTPNGQGLSGVCHLQNDILTAASLKPGKEAWITISYSKDGREVGYYQFELSEAKPVELTELGSVKPLKKVSCTTEPDGTIVLAANGTSARIAPSGLLISFVKGRVEYIIEPLRPIFTRVATDNDIRGWYKPSRPYYTSGEFDFTPTLGRVTSSSVEYVLTATEVTLHLTYAMDEKGALTVDYDATFASDFAGEPLRVGLYGIVRAEGGAMEFVGRGPWENYCDRNASALLGRYSGKIEDFAFEYIRPQENGNHTDVRYLKLGNTLEFTAVGAPFEAGVNNASFEGLSGKKHTVDVVRLPAGQAALYLQAAQAGVGGTDSWSRRAAPLAPYRLTDKNYHFRFTVK